MEIEDMESAIKSLDKIRELAVDVIPKLKEFQEEAEILKSIQLSGMEGLSKRLECLSIVIETEFLILQLEQLINMISKRVKRRYVLEE